LPLHLQLPLTAAAVRQLCPPRQDPRRALERVVLRHLQRCPIQKLRWH
jgi:hypothetical protein